MASRPIPIRPGRFLPRDPRVDAPYRLTPQLVFRIGILGFLTLAAFAVLFFRLWALEVLSGNQYLVAWSDAPRDKVYGSRVSGDGVPLDPDGIRISPATSSDAEYPETIWAGTTYVVAWGPFPTADLS